MNMRLMRKDCNTPYTNHNSTYKVVFAPTLTTFLCLLHKHVTQGSTQETQEKQTLKRKLPTLGSKHSTVLLNIYIALKTKME